MHIASTLRRKRDEIAATIAAYEARIDAARMDLAALDQAAQLFDPEGGGAETAIHREFGRLGKAQEIPASQCEVWNSDRPLAMGRLAVPVARAEGSDDQDAGPFKSIGVQEPQLTSEAAYPATHRMGEEIPAEFFYLNWP